MSRIGSKFDELKKLNKKALITYVTAGDPTIDTTIRLVHEMESRGADIVELGIPFSDPVAEGPVIQAASERALKNKIRIADVYNAVKEIRKKSNVPIVFLLYYNCIFKYGAERFLEGCTDAGVDGLIIPDLPFEEKDEIDSLVSRYPVDLISMVAPTSKDRLEQVAKDAKGFLYCVSSLGVTGVRSSFNTDFTEMFKEIGKYSKIPSAIGFGISTPDHIRSLKGYCDGLIVGSAVVKRIEGSSSPDEAVKNVGDYVESLRAAMDE